MLVNELKKEIEKYDKNELKKIIVELYKRIPKNKKEDYSIDEFIKDIKINNKSTKKEVLFENLQKEIIYFLQLVDNDYYATPNKIVSKKERSAWRFKVKRYYKELNNILPNSENGNSATILLIEIFRRLSIGSNRLLFINWETFRALGVSQAEYYDTIMKRILYNGYTKENLEKCIDLLDVLKDPYDLSCCMFWIFMSNLKTINNKEISLELLKDKVSTMKLHLNETKNSHEEYAITDNINNYIECILEIYLTINEYECGIAYFHKNYIEDDKEIKEYVLLGKLEELNLTKEWIKEYESNNNIKFRNSINEKYTKFKKAISV